MILWRLCRERHAAAAFDGEGARLYPGRFNQRGTRVVYTSGSLALAALEMLCHFDHAEAPDDYVAIALEAFDGASMATINPRSLPKLWRDSPPAESVQAIGTKWVNRGKTLLLRVPSAVIPQEMNYLVNPAHPEFKRCRVRRPTRFSFDARLL